MNQKKLFKKNFVNLLLLEVIEDLQRKKFEDNLLSKSDDNEKRKAKIEAFKKKLEEEKIKDFDDLKTIIDKTDPTRGNYKRWLYDKWFSGGFKLEDSDKVNSYLKTYHENRKKLPKEYQDIGKISSSGELFEILKDNSLIGLETSQINPEEIQALEKSGDIQRFGENEEWIGWILKTTKGSCALGKNTEWCTAKFGEDDPRNMFTRYDTYGEIYTFIRKKSGHPSKVQVHFKTNQIMDENDNEVELPKGIKEIFYSSKNESALLGILKTETDPEILDKSIRDNSKHTELILNVLSKDILLPKTLEFLANNSDEKVVRYLLRSIIYNEEKITSKLLDNLAKNIHADFEIKEFVAENPKTLPDTLSLLVKDSSPKVREKAIQNDNIKQEDLLNAFNDEEEFSVVQAIIKNKKLPSDILEDIINPESGLYKEVFENLIKKYNITDPKELSDTKDGFLKIFKNSAILNHNISEELLRNLIKENEKLLNLAKYNPKTPPDLLQLYFDKMINDPVVPTNQPEFEKRFIGFTTNPNTPSDILNKLAVNKQSTKDMLKNIIKNPSVSEETLRYLSSLIPKEWWYIDIVDKAKKALAEKNQQNLVEALILDKIFSKLLNSKTYRS